MRQGIVRGNGTGSHLIVHAAPTPLIIVSMTAEGNSSASLILMCETAEFYPENFTLTWYKNGVETATGIHTIKRQNTEGLYEVSSTLEETQPVSSGAKYTCSVSHVSLETPAVITYTKSNPGHGFSISLLMIVRLLMAFLVILALTAIIVDHVKISSIEGFYVGLKNSYRRRHFPSDFVNIALTSVKAAGSVFSNCSLIRYTYLSE
ncbi:H-2 class II histocompatibility antigen, A-S beta chain-like [Heptranchias perlo]|uniref:H-2 class II histocompatibility antigen, A-S beta chain-like n=1 Tax=Heptranchias perlo TaxID=212740 RepID=UPI00355AA60F